MCLIPQKLTCHCPEASAAKWEGAACFLWGDLWSLKMPDLFLFLTTSEGRSSRGLFLAVPRSTVRYWLNKAPCHWFIDLRLLHTHLSIQSTLRKNTDNSVWRNKEKIVHVCILAKDKRKLRLMNRNLALNANVQMTASYLSGSYQ